MQTVLEIAIVILTADFVSGLLHWLEDSYGRPDWPVTGRWITKPNILHHKRPNAFTENSWLHSATVLLVLGAAIVGTAWLIDMLTWQLLMFVAIGVNGNEIHKWNHMPRKNRSAVVLMLQDAGLLQSAKHHIGHHVGSKDSHYCVLTNVVNPVLDGIRFWRGLEWIIEQALGVQKRPEPETKALAGRVMKASELKRETG